MVWEATGRIGESVQGFPLPNSGQQSCAQEAASLEVHSGRTSYSDMAVFEEVCQGVQLTGGVEVSGLVSLANKPATKSTQELRSSAAQLSKGIPQRVRPQSPDVDQVVLKKTQDKVAKAG